MNNLKLNFYCDESCHTYNENIDVMALSTVFCSDTRVKQVNKDIREIKVKHGFNPNYEIKWNKVSKVTIEMIIEILNYVKVIEFIRIRALLIPNKNDLRLDLKQQTFDEWYHSMYYVLLKHPVKHVESHYDKEIGLVKLFIDTKDSNSTKNYDKLSERLNANFFSNIDFKAYASNSKEHQLIQISDIVAGAITFKNRNLAVNKYKLQLCEFIENNFGLLTSTSRYTDFKFNLLVWKGNVS